MKTFVKIHAITAIAIWVIAIFSGVGVLSEGGLAAAGTLFILAITTFIMIIDMLSIYFAKKQKTSVFSVISIVFWGGIFIVYGQALFSSNPLFNASMLYGLITAIAILKITASVFIITFKEEIL